MAKKKTTTRKKTAKKTETVALSQPKAKGPGIIASIEEWLRAATASKPLSKEDLVKKLSQRFKDRDPESMGKTVAVQVPSRLKTDKGITVQTKKVDGLTKYWIK